MEWVQTYYGAVILAPVALDVSIVALLLSKVWCKRRNCAESA